MIHNAILAKENNSDGKFCSQNTNWSTIYLSVYYPRRSNFERFYQKYQYFFDIDCQKWTDEK